MKAFVNAVLFVGLSLSLTANAADPSLKGSRVNIVTLYGTVDYSWAEKQLSKEGLVPVKTIQGARERVVSGLVYYEIKDLHSTKQPAKRISGEMTYAPIAAKKAGANNQEPGYFFAARSTNNSEVAELLKPSDAGFEVDDKMELRLDTQNHTSTLKGNLVAYMADAPVATEGAADPLNSVMVIPQPVDIVTRVFTGGSSVYEVIGHYKNGDVLYSRLFNPKRGDKIDIGASSGAWQKYFTESGFEPLYWLYTDRASATITEAKAVQ